MNRFFLALVCAVLVWLGCTPTAAYQCRGGDSGATQWHTVEARGVQSAREDNGFAECRATNESVELVVGEEYAGARTQTCVAMVVIKAKWKPRERGKPGPKWPTTFEVFRGRGRTPQRATGDAHFAYSDWLEAQSVEELASHEVLTVGPKWPEHVVTRCWQGDNVPRDVVGWPMTEGSYAGPTADRFDGMEWRQVKPNGDVYAPIRCQEWAGTGMRWVTKRIEERVDHPELSPEAWDNVPEIYTCLIEMSFRPLVQGSDGRSRTIGIEVPKAQWFDQMCGPATFAQSSGESALRYGTTDIHLVGFSGTCWPTNQSMPTRPPLGWRGTSLPWAAR